MRINRLWVVRNPSPISVLADILFEATPEFLGDYIRGCAADAWASEMHTLYTTEAEATVEAFARMTARDTARAVRARAAAVASAYATNDVAELAMGFLIQFAADEIDAPGDVADAVNSFDLATTEDAERSAVADLRIALNRWLAADRAACVGLLAPAFGIDCGTTAEPEECKGCGNPLTETPCPICQAPRVTIRGGASSVPQ